MLRTQRTRACCAEALENPDCTHSCSYTANSVAWNYKHTVCECVCLWGDVCRFCVSAECGMVLVKQPLCKCFPSHAHTRTQVPLGYLLFNRQVLTWKENSTCMFVHTDLFLQRLLHDQLLGISYALQFHPQEHACWWCVPLCYICTHTHKQKCLSIFSVIHNASLVIQCFK